MSHRFPEGIRNSVATAVIGDLLDQVSDGLLSGIELRDQSGPVLREHALGPFNDRQLGALDIDLDQPDATFQAAGLFVECRYRNLDRGAIANRSLADIEFSRARLERYATWSVP